jgi:energy-coupling factor transporter ATP-binding protein EcfA2
MTEHRWIEVPLTITDKIGQWAVWAGTRFIVISPLLVASSLECISGIVNKLAKEFKHSYTKLLIVYDALPYGGMEGSKLIQTEARVVHQSIEPITDIFTEIDGKQVMILGEMGTGKSTLAQYLAYTVGGQIKVYEPEGTPTDWKGLEVIGKGEDWDAIDEALADDLDDLSNQMKLRTERGDGSLEGTEKCIIAEEFPEIVSKCEHSTEWLERHARRGRKARRFLVLLSQYDRVSAWGMEGKSDLLDCFRRIRLGKKALAHAKSLKNDPLMEWLKADRSRALIDDEPLILPPYREMKTAISRPQLSYQSAIPQTLQLTPEATEESAFEPISQEFQPTLEGILEAIEAGKSDDWITKHVLGTPGGSTYSRNKARVAALRATE